MKARLNNIQIPIEKRSTATSSCCFSQVLMATQVSMRMIGSQPWQGLEDMGVEGDDDNPYVQNTGPTGSWQGEIRLPSFSEDRCGGLHT